MKLQTYVNDEVLNMLKAGQEVTPILGSYFDGSGYVQMYDVLKTASGLNSFFFAIKVGSTDAGHAHELCTMSSDGNIHELTLEVPDELCHQMLYYTYTDLIYFNELGDDTELPYINSCIEDINNQELQMEGPIQVIYPSIKPEYIISMEEK